MNDPTSTNLTIITGASQGIGKECARLFDSKGHQVFLLSRNRTALEALRNELTNAVVIPCDLADSASIQNASRELQKHVSLFSKVDQICLINNAGIFHSQSFSQTSEQVWQQIFQTNLLGPAELTRSLLSTLKQVEAAHILNISSTLGVKPTSMTSAYSASKAAMINWTLSLAQELGDFGIRVNCICPGVIDTPIHAFHDLPAQEKNAAATQIQNLQLLKCLGQPQQIAEAAWFLSSQASSFTTGSILHIDGGIHIK